MRIQFENWSLTSREIYIVIAWLAIFVLCGLGMATCINDHNTDIDTKYIQAIGIEANGEKMHQALITDAGDVIVSANFKTVDPVSDSHINGEWLRIKAILEKEEPEVNVGIDADGNPYTYTSWEWNEKKRWTYSATRIKCNGIEFSVSDFDYSNIDEKYFCVKLDTSFFERNTRIKFYCLPSEFSGAFFTTFNNKRMENRPEIYQNINHEELREKLTTHYDSVFGWIFLTVFFGFIAGIFVYAENDWLEKHD